MEQLMHHVASPHSTEEHHAASPRTNAQSAEQQRTPSSRLDSQRGFATGRLLIGLATLAIFIAALLPFLRRVRATANDTNAQTDLITIGKAQYDLHQKTGAYATSLTQLTLTPQLASGASNGHTFRILTATTDSFLIEAAPTQPGASGYKTCTINQQLTIHC